MTPSSSRPGFAATTRRTQRQRKANTVPGDLMKEVRNRPIPQVREVLTEWLEGESGRFDGVRGLYVHQRNRRYIHYLLARMTAWLDRQLGKGTTVAARIR